MGHISSIGELLKNAAELIGGVAALIFATKELLGFLKK